MELIQLDSPTETSSDEESSDDNSGPAPSPRTPRLMCINDTPTRSTIRAAKRAMEYIESVSV